MNSGEQIHDCGGIGTAHSKIYHGDVIRRGRGHGLSISNDFALIPLREFFEVIAEVGQKDVLTK